MNCIPIYEMEKNYEDCSLVIAGCGTSYNQLPSDDFLEMFGPKCYVFAANAAITRHYENPNHFWLCNDVERIIRYREFHSFVRGYKKWQLVTRRCLLPGKLGDGPYRGVGDKKIASNFPWRIPEILVKKGTVYYFNEFEDQESFCPHFEGVVEMGLWLAKIWGFKKVLLVGVDVHEDYRGKYGKHWGWKDHRDREEKFANMRKALIYRRHEFPADIYHCSGPFRDIMEKGTPQHVPPYYEYIPPSEIKSFAEK